jgi:N-methylhydantoinase A
MAVDERIEGPAIVESSFTTIVLNPGASAVRAASGSLVIAPGPGASLGAGTGASEAVR